LKFLAIPATGSLGIVFGFLLISAGNQRASSARRGKSVTYSVIVIALFLLVITWTGCGGGSKQNTTSTTPSASSPSSTPVTGTVVVQGTSGADIHIVPVTVTVN